MARGETGLAVDDERALRSDNDRVQVEFDELRDFLGDAGHQFYERRQRLSIHG